VNSIRLLISTSLRVNGEVQMTPMTCILADLNRTLVGWFGYFKHSYYTPLRPLDRWIRGRLRSISRKRAGLRGRGRGADHQRWPDHYFAEVGYFSLEVAYATACQSP
jgi:RNA-directed DNA polymerase